jgi:hypothetical protein
MAENEIGITSRDRALGSDLLFRLPERLQIVLELPQRTFTAPIWSR